MVKLLGIPFDFLGMTYYSSDNDDIVIGDKVVVETPHGIYIGIVSVIREAKESEINKDNFISLFPPIIRKADFKDERFQEKAVVNGAEISKYTQKLSNEMNLGMKVLKTYLDLSGDKVLITFTSDARVDFRELVRILNTKYHVKLELRQIGPRDQAKIIGGIGICGLPICCSTFLNSFDGISISMAKNQLLAINIPKLSGQCGKLMCCLKFEDQIYSEIRPQYPKIGEKFTYQKKQYEVTSINLLTDTITASCSDTYENFTKEQYERVLKGQSKTDEVLPRGDINEGVDLSGKGIIETNRRLQEIDTREKQHQEEVSNQNNRNNRPNNNNNRNNNRNNNHFNNHNRNNNQNYSYGGNRHNNNRSYGSNNTFKKSSGFIPVSQIADKSILDFKPVKKETDNEEK